MSINNEQDFIGHLTATPELRATADGKEVCSFSIGVDRGWGERKRAIFPRLVAFGKTAKYVSTLPKGTEISVKCEYDIREYEKDGKKQQSHEFTVIDLKAHRSAAPAETQPAFATPAQPQFEELGADDPLPF